ncbi:MAG: LacI family DNA-binding transcriptional regulator [Kineosporiaceae bacterium]
MSAETSKRAPTLDDVAALAGVGRGTASRALNGARNVSESAAERVRRAAETLGYRPNNAARSLATGRTGLVGLLVDEREDTVFLDPFFLRVARGASRALDGSGYALVLAFAATTARRDELFDVATTRLDGIIVASHHADTPMPAADSAAASPVVYLGRPVHAPALETMSWVDADSHAGAVAAVRHLRDNGRRCVGTITGALDMAAGQDRLDGWRDAVAELGLPDDDDLVVEGDFGPGAGETGMRRLLSGRPDLDAVFVASDTMALGALRVLREKGLRVPQDVAVVGFDDIPQAREQNPPLTTVRQDVEALGRRTGEILLRRLRGDPGIAQEIIPVELVVRASGGAGDRT